jgi:uncharacterized membrane protein HdeD (DUF308 family)
MEFQSQWRFWHQLTLFGGVVLLHGIACCLLIPATTDPRIQTARLLFSCGVATVAVSLLLRHWVVARLIFWIGGLRLVGALVPLSTGQTESPDYRHLLVVIMMLVAIVEFLAAQRLRRAEQSFKALQLSAIVGIMASAGMLQGYPFISDERLGVLLGVSLSASGLALLGMAFATRRSFRAAEATFKQVESEQTQGAISA